MVLCTFLCAVLLSIHTHFPLGITFRIRDLEVFYGMGSQLFCELVPPVSRCLCFQINGMACLGGVPPAKGAGRGTFRSRFFSDFLNLLLYPGSTVLVLTTLQNYCKPSKSFRLLFDLRLLLVSENLL